MDLDNDGVLDLYSGAYSCSPTRNFAPVQFFKGNKDNPLNFSPPVAVKTLSGGLPDLKKFLTIINPETKRRIFFNPAPAKTKPNFVDLDADGNLDLVYGEQFGHFIRFNGSAGKGVDRFSDKAEILRDVDGNLLKVSFSASPHFIDWDGDSDIDIISGNGQGGVYYAENTGDAQNPKWQPFTEWLPPTASNERTKGRSTIQNSRLKLQPNSETTVYVSDYNNDGKLDLLVGDKTTLDTPLEGVSNEEYAKKEAEYRAMQDAYSPYKKAMDAYYDLADVTNKTAEQKEAAKKALAHADKLSNEEYKQEVAFKNSFKTSKKVGFVWVYLQK